MRSNNPNATHFLLKRNMFVGVIIFLIVFFMLPFWGLANIPGSKEEILTYTYPHMQHQVLSELTSIRVIYSMPSEVWVISFGGMGFLTAMVLMRHLFSRRQGMLQAALPDKREMDFLRRVIGYGVLCVAPIVLNFLLYLLIIAVNGLLSYVAWGELLSRFGLLLLINLYGFAVGVLASVLTGTYWSALLAGAVLIVGVECLAILWRKLAECYLHTIVDIGSAKVLDGFSPAFALYKGFSNPEVFRWWIAVLAILIAIGLSFVLYRVRKTEAAEHTLAFGWLNTVMSFVLPLMGGSFLGMVLLLSFGIELSLIVGMGLGAGLTYLLCQIVFNQRFSGMLRKWYLPVAAAAVLILGVAVLHTDVMGYDHFLPEREKLTAISYYPTGYHSDERITLSGEDALDAAYDWCSLMRSEVDGMNNGVNQGRMSNTASSVVVTYHMGDRTAERFYPNRRIRTDAQPYLQEVIDSDDYKQSLITQYHLDDGKAINLFLSVSGDVLQSDELGSRFGLVPEYMMMNRETDAVAFDKAIAALKEDILNRTFADKKKEHIFFLSVDSYDPETNTYDYDRIPVYSCDVHFLKLYLGDKMQEVVDYVSGGYAADEDMVALRVTYVMSRDDLLRSGMDENSLVKNISLASSPEEAMKWVGFTQNTSAVNYYYMPDYENKSYSQLYLYRMSEVERYSTINHFEIPEDKTLLYSTGGAPVRSIRDFIGR